MDPRVRASGRRAARGGLRRHGRGPTGSGYERARKSLDGVRVGASGAGPGPRRPLGYVREYAVAWLRLARSLRRCIASARVDLVLVCTPPDLPSLSRCRLRAAAPRVVFDLREISPELYEAKFRRRGSTTGCCSQPSATRSVTRTR